MAKVKMEFDAQTGKAVQGFLKLAEGQKRVEGGSGRMARSHGRASQAMMRQVGSVIASYVGLQAILGTTRRLFRELAEDRRRAAEETRGQMATMGQLAQLAGRDPQELARMQDAVKASRLEVGLTNEQATALQFTLESTGLARHRRMFAGMGLITETPSELVRGVSKMQEALGVSETGGARAVLNKLLAASKASETRVEEFAPMASIAAQEYKPLGGSDEELLATLSVLAKATKSPEAAGNMVAALSRVLTKKGLKGGLLAGVEQIEEMGLSEQGLIKYLGEARALRGYRAIRDQMGQIGAMEETLAREDRLSGKGADYISGMLQNLADDKRFQAVVAGRQQKQILALEREKDLGPGAVLMEAERAGLEAAGYRLDKSAVTRKAEEWMTAAWQGITGMPLDPQIGANQMKRAADAIVGAAGVIRDAVAGGGLAPSPAVDAE